MRFSTIDGEAAGDRYFLLACSDGSSVENPDGLQTTQCLRFLTTRPHSTLWGFAFTYDVNQILAGLDRPSLLRLDWKNRTYYGDYQIVHLPGKLFRVTDRETGYTCTVWDAYSFVRCSFARWLRDWHICGDKELAFIEEMKDLRPDFSPEMIPRIREYNQRELELLQRAVQELLERIRASGYKPATFHSPGSVAAAVMKHYGVKERKGELPDIVARAARSAYYGGRFETRYIGRMPGPLYHYDINSAYPAAAAGLPCLACGSWHRWTKPEVDPPGNLLYVTWRPRTPYKERRQRPPFGPFPVRLPAGSLRYPLVSNEGGWYWSQEVAAAAPLTSLHIHKALRFEAGCEHRPFHFIPDLYGLRHDLKAAGDPVEYVYKLVLNSCYGKLAQRPRSETDKPAYYQPAWAGSITATTRGMLLRAIAQNPAAVIQTATDGLTSRARLDLPLSDQLGDWSLQILDLLLVVQSGIYFWRVQGGETVQRSRGFHPASLTFERCADHLTHSPRQALELENRRFVGYRTALHRGNLELWRQWVTYSARLETTPEPRRETLRRRNGYLVSVPPILAAASMADEIQDPFLFLDGWEGEQPDGPEGDSL